MASVRQLEEDVRYWENKVKTFGDEQREASRKLQDRMRELAQAREDEARDLKRAA